MQTLVQLLPGTLLLALTQLMFIYQPHEYSNDRVVWYGESTQFCYEKEALDANGCPQWVDTGVRVLNDGMPTGVSELHAQLVDYYNHCQITDHI